MFSALTTITIAIAVLAIIQFWLAIRVLKARKARNLMNDAIYSQEGRLSVLERRCD